MLKFAREFLKKKFSEKSRANFSKLAELIVRNLIGFHRMELFVKTGAFWEEMINTKNFEFFLKFVILGFLKLRSPKRSPQNCQNIGDYLKNLKISCFLDLQLWISFETSFSSFELKKNTHVRISAYINGAQNGARGVLRPKIPPKFDVNSSCISFSPH